MLQLLIAGNPVFTVVPGSKFTLPNGNVVSPAYAGWRDAEEGYELVAVPDPEPQPVVITADDVDRERDRRMYGTFQFNGKYFDADRDSLQRISGAATLAGLSMAFGSGTPGNLYWHGGELPFAWIAGDNDIVEMDAPTTFAFGQAAAAHVTAHIFAARALKDQAPNIPGDYLSNTYWPAA